MMIGKLTGQDVSHELQYDACRFWCFLCNDEKFKNYVPSATGVLAVVSIFHGQKRALQQVLDKWDLYHCPHTAKSKAKHIMKVTRKKFSKWESKISDSLIDHKQVKLPVWILPSPEYAVQYIKYGIYILSETTTKSQCVQGWRENC